MGRQDSDGERGGGRSAVQVPCMCMAWHGVSGLVGWRVFLIKGSRSHVDGMARVLAGCDEQDLTGPQQTPCRAQGSNS